jgi:serine/threonine-protein kinase
MTSLPPEPETSHANLPFRLPQRGATISSPVTFNAYTVGEPIGEGEFGVVFACTDVWGNDLVAKVLKPNGFEFWQAEEKAKSEIDALYLARHPNIVYVHDAFVFHGACYIVSERCEMTLRQMWLDPEHKPDVWFKAISRCILQAVHFAHVQGIAHCDIHPGNIFAKFIPDEIMPSEQSAVTFKLGDFGLAKRWDCVSAEGTFLKSIRPPEAIQSDEFGVTDTRVDIYHVGLILLQAY